MGRKRIVPAHQRESENYGPRHAGLRHQQVLCCSSPLSLIQNPAHRHLHRMLSISIISGSPPNASAIECQHRLGRISIVVVVVLHCERSFPNRCCPSPTTLDPRASKVLPSLYHLVNSFLFPFLTFENHRNLVFCGRRWHQRNDRYQRRSPR